MAAKEVTVQFMKSKETKGTFCYTEDGDDVKVGTLYIKKATAATLGNPEKLTVTITADA
jgi:hypothetical protein